MRAGERTDTSHITGAGGGAAKVTMASVARCGRSDRRPPPVTLDGLRSEYTVARTDSRIWWRRGATAVLEGVREAPVRPGRTSHTGDAELTSPMPLGRSSR